MGMVRRRTRRRTMMVAGGLRVRTAGETKDSRTCTKASRRTRSRHRRPRHRRPRRARMTRRSELERLASLHASGALSDDELAVAKQQVLGA